MYNGEQGHILTEAVMNATDHVMRALPELAEAAKSGDATAVAAFQKATKVEQLLRSFDLDTSSGQGGGLGARRGKLNTGAMREVTVEKILEAKGIRPELATEAQRLSAQYEYAETIANRMDAIAKDQALVKLEDAIDEAIKSGNLSEAARLGIEKRAMFEAKLQKELEGKSGSQRVIGKFNNFVNKLNEWVISNVFSSSTVMVNLLPAIAKLIYRPALDAIARNPLDGVSWRIAAAQYSTYASSLNIAGKAAAAAFRYEKGLLSGDFALYAGRDPAFQKWYGGGILRFFPRVLGASDEFFSQLAYRAYVYSENLGQALQAGREMGMSKGALRQWATERATKALEGSFEKNVGAEAIDMLVKEGVSRGYAGQKLQLWVQAQLDKNKEFFKTATNQTGIGYAEDLLFKREFSGEGVASLAAQRYEQFVNKVPVMRLMGQLFFRTPVRVFEEGFRLTPGLNVASGAFAGKFLSDLAGKNGMQAQLRAQGEAMLSLGIGAMVINAYASGNLSGGGPDDWKQRRTTEDGKAWKPYTWKVGDYELNFRNLDPLATPLKIMTNIMDRLAVLEYRRAQGEYDNKSDFREAAAQMSVISLSIVQAIRDANLTEGIDQLAKFMEDITNPEEKEMALLKFFGQKAQLFLPNQWTKIQALEENNINDPATVEQYIRARWNPGDPLVPRRYDALGDVVTNSNPWAGLTGINLAERREEFTKREEVKQELAKLAFNGDKNFQAPYTVSYIPEFKGKDLRTMTLSDGSGKTWYDAWQEEISRTRMSDMLHKYVVENQKLPMGTKSVPGAKEEVATKIVNHYRKEAFMAVMKREFPGLDPLIRSKMEEGAAKMGKKETTFSGPYQ